MAKSGVEKETTWIDAWIRWERDSKETFIENDDEQAEEEAPVLPTETFSFTYPLPSSSSNNNKNIDLELEGFPSDSEQIWNSTGLTLWPCSHYLCEYLLQQDFSNVQNIMELGAGLGRCGLLVHQILENNNTNIDCHVYLTDGDTDTLKVLRNNVAHNTKKEEDNDQGSSSCSVSISCHQLLWGSASTTAFMEQHDLCQKGVDFVLGSDLVYVPKVIQPLFETVHTLLLQRSGNNHDDHDEKNYAKFVLAHSDRRQGSSVTLDMVLEGATKVGLSHKIVWEKESEGIFIIEFFIQKGT